MLNYRISIAVAIFGITLLFLPLGARAIKADDYPELKSFMQQMQQRHGFKAGELQHWFEQASMRPDIIEAMDRPSEALPWHEYRKRFVTDRHTEQGKEFWSAHKEVFNKIEAQYGIPAEIILAIIGVETRYGRNTGSYRVIDALTTLTLDYPRRSSFFRKELEHFLLLARELDRDPVSIKGSYAGAIGMPQFMPSSYRSYAVDFEGKKKPNLIDDAGDTIASVANYFKRHGWRAGEPITDDVQSDGVYYKWFDNMGIKPKLQLKHFISYGMHPVTYKNEELDTVLLRFDGEDGPLYRFGFHNFYVLTRYNHSSNYAMSVFELSQRIKQAINQP